MWNLWEPKLKYCPIAVKSDILEAIQASQYVQPMTNPAKGPMYSFAISTNELKRVLLNNNSPSARMNANMTIPIIMYVSKREGPVKAIVCPEPRNNPVPIAPPIAIN